MYLVLFWCKQLTSWFCDPGVRPWEASLECRGMGIAGQVWVEPWTSPEMPFALAEPLLDRSGNGSAWTLGGLGLSVGLTKAKHQLEYKSEHCGEDPSTHITIRLTYSLIHLALAVSASASACPGSVAFCHPFLLIWNYLFCCYFSPISAIMKSPPACGETPSATQESRPAATLHKYLLTTVAGLRANFKNHVPGWHFNLQLKCKTSVPLMHSSLQPIWPFAQMAGHNVILQDFDGNTIAGRS